MAEPESTLVFPSGSSCRQECVTHPYNLLLLSASSHRVSIPKAGLKLSGRAIAMAVEQAITAIGLT